MTTEQIRTQGRRAWRLVEVLVTIGGLVLGGLVASGWRIQQPNQRMAETDAAIDTVEQRILVLERNYEKLESGVRTVIRMQCLSISRHDANLAGTCTGLPTRDDSPSARTVDP